MKKFLIFLILALFPFLGFSQSSNSRFEIRVDSTMNYDTMHTVTVILKPNHGIPKFLILCQMATLGTGLILYVQDVAALQKQEQFTPS
jgi:hypothetical protein